jgi:hypothetical protein
MAQHRPRDIPRFLLPGPDLHGPVPVLVSPLMRHNFIAVELQNCACCALPCFRIVDGCHALFQGEEAGPQGRAVGFSLERCRRCAGEGFSRGVVCEAIGSGCKGGFYGSD